MGFRKANEVLPAIAVAGGSFALTQFLSSNFLGPELPDILSAIVSLVCLTLFLKVWKPKTIYRFAHEEAVDARKEAEHQYTIGQIFKAWSPFLLLTGFITLWGVPAVKSALIGKYAGTNGLLKWISENIGHYLSFYPNVPGLHNLIIGTNGKPIAATFKLELLGAAGTAILLAAIMTKFIVGISWKDWFAAFGQTVNELKLPVLNIAAVVGFAYITNASGMSTTLGKVLAHTGTLFPFFSPFLGWLGVFITGSDTSSNLLFGNLQKLTAQGVDMSPVLAVAANTSGGVTGKMISPQSIAVACASVGLSGKESDLFRFTVKHSVFLVVLVGIITYLQATVLTWMIP